MDDTTLQVDHLNILSQVGLALFTLFSPEPRLWVGTFHVILQSNHQLMTASTSM
jgi:hypothetical protein